MVGTYRAPMREDGTTQLPRTRHGEPIPDLRAAGYPHTQLGERLSRRGNPYNQAREFGYGGRHVKDIDFTDHNDPAIHPNPHQHRIDPVTGTRLFKGRVPQEPLIPVAPDLLDQG
jgi:hypothetical protein